jgi:hypothetical protein
MFLCVSLDFLCIFLRNFLLCEQHAHQFLHPSAWALLKMMLTHVSLCFLGFSLHFPAKFQHAHQFLHPSAWALVKMMLTLFFVAHSLGCMWHWMATLNGSGITWTTKYGIDVS